MRTQRTSMSLWEAVANALAHKNLHNPRQRHASVFRIRCREEARIIWAMIAAGTCREPAPLLDLQSLMRLVRGRELGTAESEDGLVSVVVFEMDGTTASSDGTFLAELSANGDE